MKKILFIFITAVLLAGICAGAGSAAVDYSDRDIIEVSCNVKEADISIVSNNTVIEKKNPVDGECLFYVNTTSSPIDTIIAENPYYQTNAISFSPQHRPGELQSTSISLSEFPSRGSDEDHGYIEVYTNVLGAKVEVKTDYGKETFTGYTNSNGKAEIRIIGKNLNIKTATISKPGWDTQVIEVTTPKSGNTISRSVTLERSVPVVPTETISPYMTYPVESVSHFPNSPLGIIPVIAGIGIVFLCLRRK